VKTMQHRARCASLDGTKEQNKEGKHKQRTGNKQGEVNKENTKTTRVFVVTYRTVTDR